MLIWNYYVYNSFSLLGLQKLIWLKCRFSEEIFFSSHSIKARRQTGIYFLWMSERLTPFGIILKAPLELLSSTVRWSMGGFSGDFNCAPVMPKGNSFSVNCAPICCRNSILCVSSTLINLFLNLLKFFYNFLLQFYDCFSTKLNSVWC